MICAIATCDRTATARGWCNSHYMAWWRRGDPEMFPDRRVPNLLNRKEIGARFWSKVDFSTPDGCWLWTGSRRHTYGEVFRDGTKMYAHRAVYELVYGPIEDGLKVCHHCDTPLCVRPDHLFAGTQTDNMRDASRKGRWRNQYAAGPAADLGGKTEGERRRMRRQRSRQ